MNTFRTLLTAVAVLAAGPVVATECDQCPDWLFAPSAYTHSPVTGQRVAQYTPVAAVEPLDDPRQTISRYWQTRTRLRGADGSSDTIYEVRSFGNTRGGFDAQRERGFDASLDTLRALTPFRHNPYLFFGGLQGFGYGFPGYPGATPGAPYAPGWTAPVNTTPEHSAPFDGAPIESGEPTTYAPAAPYYPGAPGTAYPYAPPTSFVAPYPYYGYPGWGYGPWSGGPWSGGPWGGGHGGGGHWGGGPPMRPHGTPGS